SEKYEVYFNIFYSECTTIFDVYIKDIKKRAKNMKFTSIFFTASAPLSSMFTSKIAIKSNAIDTLIFFNN
ncbi:MAG: hypothetical protein IJA04_06505, partial [Bacteroidaceae bacterium]|nr:hypothetical protein [Bacteroidaceae bacterium]